MDGCGWTRVGVEGLGLVWRAWDGCGRPKMSEEGLGGCKGPGKGVDCRGPGIDVEFQR